MKQAAYGGVTHTFNYDSVGNVTSINASSGNATFAYDAQNRATSISKGGVTQTFKYDPDGETLLQEEYGRQQVHVLPVWRDLSGNAHWLRRHRLPQDPGN